MVESTYGDRKHPERDMQQLGNAINRTLRRGGSVLIPAFAVDRTEILLHAVGELRASGEIPDVPIVLDSPMALRALEVYRSAFDGGAADVRPGVQGFLESSKIETLTTAEESRRVNSPDYPMIIISASGMATGGRVLHHLRHQLPDPKNTILLVGYQAAGTRGHRLIEGDRAIKIFGEYVPVRAEIVDIRGFSVHADADEILAWLGALPQTPSVCLVNHGEPRASATLRDRISDELGWTSVVPRPGERILVTPR